MEQTTISVYGSDLKRLKAFKVKLEEDSGIADLKWNQVIRALLDYYDVQEGDKL